MITTWRRPAAVHGPGAREVRRHGRGLSAPRARRLRKITACEREVLALIAAARDRVILAFQAWLATA
jgi:hypothetical protein